MKKIMVIALLAVVLAFGASAQLMLGVSGALHMDQYMSASEIKNSFQTGDGVFYGGFVEIAGRHLGLGFAGNISKYDRDVSISYYDSFTSTYYVQTQTMNFTDYDLTLYLSYHLFGGHAFLDPFGEFGGGILATGFTNSSDNDLYNPYDGNFLFASYYWYGALGLGLNLGPIGVFGKFAFNFPVKSKFSTTWKNSGGVSTDLYPYGYDAVLYPDGYLPLYRFTLGVKLIL